MTTPILNSQKNPDRRSAAVGLIIFGFILSVAFVVGVVVGIAWLVSMSLGLPLWNTIGVVIALILIVAIGTRLGAKRK